MTMNSDTEQNDEWRMLDHNDKELSLGTLCRITPQKSVFSTWLRCDLFGGLTPGDEHIVNLKHNDSLVFLRCVDRGSWTLGKTNVPKARFGVFISKFGLVNGSLKDIEIHCK